MSKVQVVFQGVLGAYSHQAIMELLGNSNKVNCTGLETFEACFEAVSSGKADYAMLPLENTMGGTIADNHDLQLRYGLYAVAEYNKPVQHALMVLPGVKREQVKFVASHYQALAQCADYLRDNMSHATIKQEFDTAGTAKKIMDENLREWAAIASTSAAEIYGLEILATEVQDSKDNITRFCLFSKKHVKTIPREAKYSLKASLVFTIENQAGSLHHAIEPFARHKVNITKLESRPDRRKAESMQCDVSALISLFGVNWMNEEEASANGKTKPTASPTEEPVRFKAMFFLDVSVSDSGASAALKELFQISNYFRVLGVYAVGGVLLGEVTERIGVKEGSLLLTNNVSSAKVSASPAKRAKQSALRIGILGFGNFGQFLAKAMVAQGHQVAACSRTDYSAVAKELKVDFYSSLEALVKEANPAVVLISVSIFSFEDTIKRIDGKLMEGRLVVDVLSVKIHPKKILLDKFASQFPSVDILCTHPMFGPESGRFSWRGLPFVFEKIKVSNQDRLADFLNIFRSSGCTMMEMTCEEHDAKAANSQFLTHLTGRFLNELHLFPSGIDTKGFTSLLALIENTCKDSDDLFEALYKHNPNAKKTLDSMENALRGIANRLKNLESSTSTLSDAVERIAPSRTNKTHALAMKLQEEKVDIITTLTVGEPNFGPPEPAIKAMQAALVEAMEPEPKSTKYTSVSGSKELRRQICLDYEKRKGVKYDLDKEVLVTGGGKQAVFEAIHALCGPGDEVIIPSPFWVSYPDICRLAGATPVFVKRDPRNNYIMTPSQLREKLTKNTKALILCNPCNPTSCLYSKEDMLALAKVLVDFPKVIIIADEIYERITYDNAAHHSFASLPGMFPRTLIVNGASKGLAMTGLRLGWICGPTHIVKACEKLQGQISSCASSLSQIGAAAALPYDPKEFGPGQANMNNLSKNRDFVFDFIAKEMPWATAVRAGGAFYAFVSVPNSKNLSGIELCEKLITRKGAVALVPGEAFGDDSSNCSFRISFACGERDLREGMIRIRDGIKELLGV